MNFALAIIKISMSVYAKTPAEMPKANVKNPKDTAKQRSAAMASTIIAMDP
jgi:hypothetical protein